MAEPFVNSTVEPRAANWPARTWQPAELVTSGMMNGVRDQLNELHGILGGGSGGGSSVAFTNVANVFTQAQYIRTPGNPSLYIYDDAQPVNYRVWRIMNQSQYLRFYTQDDGESGHVTRAAISHDGHMLVLGRLQIGRADVPANNVPALRNTGAVLDVVLGDQSNWAGLQCLNIYTVSTSNNFGDLTVRGGTNFQGGVTVTGGDVNAYAGALLAAGIVQSGGAVYPGRLDTGWTQQGSWFLASHGGYGLYCNTGFYVEGGVYPAVLDCRSTLTVAGAANLNGGISSAGGATLRGYVYIETGAPAGDCSLFLNNPVAGTWKVFRVMSYADCFRIWNQDATELFRIDGGGNGNFAGMLSMHGIEARYHVRAATGVYDYGRGYPMGDWMDFSPSTWANIGAGALQANYGCRWTTVGHTMFVTFYIVVYTDSYPNWIYLSIPNGWTAATNVATAGACAGATGGFAGGSAAFSIQVMPGANYMQLGRVLDGGQVWNPPGNVTLAGSIAFSIN